MTQSDGYLGARPSLLTGHQAGRDDAIHYAYGGGGATAGSAARKRARGQGLCGGLGERGDGSGGLAVWQVVHRKRVSRHLRETLCDGKK